MSETDKAVLADEQPESLDDIHAVIGQMAFALLKSGQPIEKGTLQARLTQHAEQAAEAEVKKECAGAVAFIARNVGR